MWRRWKRLDSPVGAEKYRIQVLLLFLVFEMRHVRQPKTTSVSLQSCRHFRSLLGRMLFRVASQCQLIYTMTSGVSVQEVRRGSALVHNKSATASCCSNWGFRPGLSDCLYVYVYSMFILTLIVASKPEHNVTWQQRWAQQQMPKHNSRPPLNRKTVKPASNGASLCLISRRHTPPAT